ncbi:MAG TPA: hypothetical protein PLT35_04735 [Vicinamibacterales bacterium]|nr:hypothetical protein [Vicinamibacterales bacterium]HOQ61204.1 hypothetical protein [Vicinamibacterales bacterium]
MSRILPFLAAAAVLSPQNPPGALYDEAKVPSYVLPDPLITTAGERVRDSKTWIGTRRPEILELYRREVFGRVPSGAPRVSFQVESTDRQALDGVAVRKIVALTFGGGAAARAARMLVYLPAGARESVPVFLSLSFGPIQTVHADPGIPLGCQWSLDADSQEAVCRPAAESSRGSLAGRWPVEAILGRGYGLAAIYYGEIEPDVVGGLRHGIRALALKEGQREPAPDEWGAIGAWAWSLSRALDYLETDRDVDAARVAVIGHSRLGKTALWAGAEDTRFSLVISNDSGEGGAALSRRTFGERTRDLNTRFPHWFCGNFKQYNDRESEMPFDAHFLLALAAPRGLYVASAAEDLWADPRGEFLAASAVEPVYALFGKSGLGTSGPAALDTPIGRTVRYHVRSGKHEITAYDWDRYLDFADAMWKQAPRPGGGLGGGPHEETRVPQVGDTGGRGGDGGRRGPGGGHGG